jgi:hypothetical protein
MAVRLSALCADRPLPPRNIFWYSFLLKAESTPGPVRLAGLGKTKTFNDLMGNHTRAFIPENWVRGCSNSGDIQLGFISGSNRSD